jgi:hypothetical protein
LTAVQLSPAHYRLPSRGKSFGRCCPDLNISPGGCLPGEGLPCFCLIPTVGHNSNNWTCAPNGGGSL